MKLFTVGVLNPYYLLICYVLEGEGIIAKIVGVARVGARVRHELGRVCVVAPATRKGIIEVNVQRKMLIKD